MAESTAPSAKRERSPSGTHELSNSAAPASSSTVASAKSTQPDAKRLKNEPAATPAPSSGAASMSAASAADEKPAADAGASAAAAPREEDAVDIGSHDDAAAPSTSNGADAAAPVKQEGAAEGDDAAGQPQQQQQQQPGESGADGLEPQHIAMRSLIITGDASIIIGKQGRHINEIRDKSGARLTISESIPGNPERIMTVAGQLDAVSKCARASFEASSATASARAADQTLTRGIVLLQAFGLIVRRINDEPFDQPSVPGSRAVTIRFIVPNSRMGSVIGKQGTKIKEIQEASGARLTAGEAMLPGSTERVLSISGVADAVHIAVYYVGTILLEHPDRNANNMTYRPTGGASSAVASVPPRGNAPYGGAPGAGSPNAGAQGGYAYGAQAAPMAGPGAGGPGMPQYGANQALPPGSQTQQIFIPNDLVGCIIGKGGQKINEIRQMSASHIKIMEPGAGIAAGGSGTERLVTITGPPANIQLAVSLLYQRLEQEKMRLSQGGVSQ
ncbi:hypothetical protein FA09DRAFT_325026 [Tilletiopsis washingtonensis]|uniref:K Homology domain-containing protein n=1 Tax=Tilletiopsis washingtonensis TaxID=58919 RepID=A0A316ZC06_9BASI|nr:hypothetical protein FA09DRAFT_325026 [Tilletiopsis washingtonensis]PWN99059.1 hypothetical protein FA09DRAFT_325026 [Tilletiopsis washingtonensis]